MLQLTQTRNRSSKLNRQIKILNERIPKSIRNNLRSPKIPSLHLGNSNSAVNPKAPLPPKIFKGAVILDIDHLARRKLFPAWVTVFERS